LTSESGIITYKAIYKKKDSKTTSEVFAITVYVKIKGGWKGVFYQQTLMGKAN
jgi:hypothetical protein